MSKTSVLKERVGAHKSVRFDFYRSGALWYICEDGFSFPVPIADTGDAVFLDTDKSVFFMRWIRIHMDYIENARILTENYEEVTEEKPR